MDSGGSLKSEVGSLRSSAFKLQTEPRCTMAFVAVSQTIVSAAEVEEESPNSAGQCAG